jgi:hypothetical protein
MAVSETLLPPSLIEYFWFCQVKPI